MNSEQWQHIKELFDSALKEAPGERSAFLQRVCGDDNSLRTELESLLSAYEQEGTFSSTPGGAPAADELPGQRIGPYQVIRRIGWGGMGAVYLAVRADDAYRKQVAIKLVRAGVDTEEILRRFRHERQILAALDHPNISRLLDGGTTDAGLPYFVMDYVEGERIDEYCNHHRLSIPERIELFRQVCSAVHYVHQNLVIHRDLKPSNILVTAQGVPKLLDFGIAKLLKPEFLADPLDATRVEMRLMTPGYSSPEQARNQPVTTATDVYSLGVILYELLTSRRPYRLQSGDPDEVLRAVCEQEPERPSVAVLQPVTGDGAEKARNPQAVGEVQGTAAKKLARQLSGDLDNIVLKALRKEPQRRYASAEQFSEDLRRYLQGLPVLARPDTWSYRTGKFMGRHRAAVAAVALIVLSLVGGILATGWQARIARAERAQAQRQFNDVRRLATSFLFQFDSAIQGLPGSTPARQLVVQRALEYLSKLSAESGGDRGLERELAEAYLKVGDIQGNPYLPNLGDTEGAVQSYRRALQLSQSLTQADGQDLEARHYLGRSYKSLGEVLPLEGKPTEGAADLRKSVAVLESLSTAEPRSEPLRSELAGSYQVLGDLLGHSGVQNLGDQAGALENYQKALVIYQAQLARDKNNQAARRGAAVLQIRIGDLQLSRDNVKASMENYGSALQTMQELSAADPNNADARRLLALTYKKVGGGHEEMGAFPEALQNYDRASAIDESLLSADPNNAQARMNLAISLRYTGDLLNRMGNRPAALAKYRRVLALLENLLTADSGNILLRERYSEMLVYTGQLLSNMGQAAEARNLTSRGLAIARTMAERPDATSDDLSQYALDFLIAQPPDLRDPALALKYAEQAVAKSENSDSLDVLAQAYYQGGDRTRAVLTEQRAIALLSADAHGDIAPQQQRLQARIAKFGAVPKRRKP